MPVDLAGTAAAVPATLRGGAARVADRSSSGIVFEDVTVAYNGLVDQSNKTMYSKNMK